MQEGICTHTHTCTHTGTQTCAHTHTPADIQHPRALTTEGPGSRAPIATSTHGAQILVSKFHPPLPGARLLGVTAVRAGRGTRGTWTPLVSVKTQRLKDEGNISKGYRNQREAASTDQI